MRNEQFTSLIDRDEELSGLMELFTECVRHGKGAVALISGPVASGKTDLLQRFGRRAKSDALVLSAFGSSVERDFPLGIVDQLLRNAPSSAEKPDVRSPVPPGSGRAELELMHGFYLTLLELSEQAPVVITVDDMQHADVMSLRCLLYSIRRSQTSRILMMFAESASPDRERAELTAELLSLPHSRRIRLAPLPESAVCDIIAEHLDAEHARRLGRTWHRITGGNPLLVGALLQDHRTAGRSGDQDIPAGKAFGEAVLACLYRSDPRICRAAYGAAVLDEFASPRLLAKLLDIDPASTSRAVHELTVAGLLDNGRFRHSGSRRAVLDDMTVEDRSALHRRSAVMLHEEGADAVTVAGHVLGAGEMDEPWVLNVLIEATESAMFGNDGELALECLKSAHRMCADEEQRTVIVMMRARAISRLDPSTAARHLVPFKAELARCRTKHKSHGRLLKCLLQYGSLDEVVGVIEHLTQSGCVLDPRGMAEVAATLEWLASSYPSVLERVQIVRAGITASVNEKTQAAAALTRVLTGRDADGTAAADAERILQGSRLDDTTVDAIVIALMVSVYADRLDTARSRCDAFLREAESLNALAWQASLNAIRAEVAIRHGDMPGAEVYAESAMSLMSAQSWGVRIGLPLASLVTAKTHMGKYEEAADILKRPVPEELYETRFGLHFRHARGNYHLSTGGFRAALDDFAACGELMRDWKMDRPTLVPWRSGAARALLRLGEAGKARTLAMEQLERAPDGDSRARGLSLSAVALTSDLKRRAALLKEASKILQKCDDRLELGHALNDLSQTYYSLKDYPRARAMKRRAENIMRECRADPRSDVTYVVAPHHGGGEVSPLSEAEERVAVLAGLGQTNREIARTLCITVSTVEQHLTRVYRKLSVNRRTELPMRLQVANVS